MKSDEVAELNYTLDAMTMDTFFADKSIYNSQDENLAEAGSNKLLLPGHFFEQATSQHIAQALNDTLRDDVYKRGLKSPNKNKLIEWEGQMYQSSFYNTRCGLAEQALVAARKRDNQKGEDNPAASILDLAHNCDELAIIAETVLYHLDLKTRSCANSTGVNHTFIVFSKNSELRCLKYPPKKETRWFRFSSQAELYVCDPWANLACAAPNYLDLFKAKMLKWQSQGKWILAAVKHINDQCISFCIPDAKPAYWECPYSDQRVALLNDDMRVTLEPAL